MKQLTILLLFIYSISFSQTTNERFGVVGTVLTKTTNSITLNQVTGNDMTDDNGTFQVSDVLPGDVLFTAQCSKYNVVSISGNTIIINDLIGTAVPISLGTKVGILRETTIGGIKLAGVLQNGDGDAGLISGITTSMNACIINHYQTNLQTILTNLTNANPTVYGEFINDQEAAIGGVPLNGIYQAAFENTMGRHWGDRVVRKF